MPEAIVATARNGPLAGARNRQRYRSKRVTCAPETHVPLLVTKNIINTADEARPP